MADIGRPTSYSQEVADTYCDRISCGMSLNAVCRMKDMPVKQTIVNWFKLHPDFLDQYTQACELRSVIDADERRELADSLDNDLVIESNRPIANALVQARKEQIRVREWQAERMSPRRWGTKTAVEHSNPDGNMGGKTIIATPEALNSIVDKL